MKTFTISLVLLFIIRLRFPTNRSIAAIITDRYGKATLHLVRKFEKLDFKCRKLSLDLEFLDNCIKHDLIPTFVRFKVANHRLKTSKAYKECQVKLLRHEISDKKSMLHSHMKKLSHLKTEVRSRISFLDFTHISSCFLVRNDKILNKTRLVQEKKLQHLGLVSAHETNDPEKVIFNFSSRFLTTSEKKLLSKGLNLSIPPKKLNYGDTLTPFELLFREILKSESLLNAEKRDPLESALRNAAYDCLNSYDTKVEQNLTPVEGVALKALLKDDSIIIQKSDKGNSVVILDKTAYVQRMSEILRDTTKFRELKIDNGKDYNHIHNQELKISRELRKLHNKGALSDKDYAKLSPCGSSPSILYGLSKVHKDVVDNSPKLRPILSAINTPTYNLSKYLAKILEPFTTNEYTAKDTFSFADEIRNQNSSLHMASLDVESLFTNIPLEETIDICAQLLFKDNLVMHGLNKDEFKSLLILATKESFILFNGSYYQQIDGVAMGSPLGPTLANIFLGYYEQKWLADCPTAFKPSFYKRYVDDIFLLFSDIRHLDQFKAYMNSRHGNMKFTSEAEIDNTLSFLDINVIRDRYHFITSVYRKPTFSGVYTNYQSFIPDIYKTGLISTLLFRMFNICSNWNLIHDEIVHLKLTMKRNAFPSNVIDTIIKRFLNHLHHQRKTAIKEPKKCLQLILPFLGSTSRKLELTINRTLKQHMPELRVKIVSRASVRLCSLFSFKDKIPSYLNSGVVYKFSCGGCNSTYIGKTKRHMKTRVCEHAGISPLTGKLLKGQNTTSVLEHSKRCNSKVKYDNFVVLCKDNCSDFHLRIKESLFIHKDKPDLNGQDGSIPLTLFKN